MSLFICRAALVNAEAATQHAAKTSRAQSVGTRFIRTTRGAKRAEDILLTGRHQEIEKRQRKRKMEQPCLIPRPEGHFHRADRPDLKQDRQALYAEGCATERTAPESDPGRGRASGADFQENRRNGPDCLRENRPCPCRQHPEVKDKAAEFQVGLGRRGEDLVQPWRGKGLRLRRCSGVPAWVQAEKNRRQQIPGKDLRDKQADSQLGASQQVPADRQDDKGRPGANTGRKQRIRFLRRHLSGADGLCRCAGGRCKSTQKTDHQDPGRAVIVQTDEPDNRTERNRKPLPCRTLDQQRGTPPEMETATAAAALRRAQAPPAEPPDRSAAPQMEEAR